MVKKIAVVVVILIVAFLGYAATRPDTYRVERAASIKAPPEKIFAHINDLRGWGAWSPWEKLDPVMKRTFSGAESGKGAVYEWEGNSEVGKGRMEIAESDPSSKIVLNLHFLEPMEGQSTAEFRLEPAGDSTNVTWTMQGSNNYVSKVIGIFVSMDKMVGGHFETGLANLKAIAEK
jgi:carbon monoxide dehydrogenase subunit G